MARKKSVRRVKPKRVRSSRKSRPRRSGKSTRRITSNLGKKIDVARKNLISFTILFIISLVLFNISSNTLLVTFFGVVSMIFGFVAVAFLIAFLVYSFVKFK